MKLVRITGSLSGAEIPELSAALMQERNQAMLSASVRIVCKPSSSRSTSSLFEPCTWFQYWEETTGMFDIMKNLFMSSNAALAPPRLQLTTALAGFPRSFEEAE